MSTEYVKTLAVRNSERGFSLVEVLVALVIIGVGMLGLAKLQALAYASTGTSSQRSLAAIEASSMVSAMRANRNYWSAVAVPLTVSITGTAVAAVGDPTLATSTYVCTYTAHPNAPCSTAQLAAYDLKQWAIALNAVLRSDSATITCTALAAALPVACIIQVTWLERNVAINMQSQGNPPLAAPTYTLYVVP